MSRLDEIKARAEQVHWTSTSIEQAMARMASSAADVPWLVYEVERLTAEREWFKDRFPCDGMCVDAPEEACSRHGRSPADLWRIIGEVDAERDALIAVGKRQAARLARVEALAEWFDSVQEEHLSQDDCQCEMKDCYECGPWHACTHDGPPARARQLRAALTGSEADTSDTQSTDQEDQS